jgi:RNA polymerase sigma-70 factor (ECF subfamily)
MHEHPDSRLISLCLSGDSEAFNTLVRRWEKRIYNFVLRYSGDREDAQDLCQEIFTAAFQRLSTLRDRERFSSWLYTIALNACRMRARSSAGKQKISLDDPEQAQTIDGQIQIRNEASSFLLDPEQTLSRKQMELSVRRAIREIPQEQREVILLKEYQNLKFHEIAEILSCPLSTVKSRLYLGLKGMRKHLEKWGITP